MSNVPEDVRRADGGLMRMARDVRSDFFRPACRSGAASFVVTMSRQ
jgi:hypothetical protein